ncbi:hypothetical protein EDC94DRAFT_530191 [Helicostylum pulchrum]|nr:hypothetical protein EDC94DRAFT_530191 [Helicostylum pulchrum]
MVSKTQKKKFKPSKSSRYDDKIKRVKLKVRSEIDLFKWQRFNFHLNDYWIDPYLDNLTRIDYRFVSKKEFVDRYEAKNIPVVITHVTDEWKANKHWTNEYLLKNYGSHLFKVGDDDNNNNVYMKMKHFLYYSHNEGLKDDSPLYIFDSGFYKSRNNSSSKKKQRSLLDDYKVPRYFNEDLFKLTGARRPPYRWLVIGGARSGTGIHKDPLGTSAWNSLIRGHKRWCLFPPPTPKELYDPPMKPYDHEGVSWFDQVYPKFKVRDQHNSQTLGEKWGMIEVIQKPGETIFVPGGWAHVVMNLDFTVAVTQNFCSSTNAEWVYLQTRHTRPKLGQKLYREIQKLGKSDPSNYAELAGVMETTQFIPQLPPSSSDSSSGSSSTSSSSISSTSTDDGTEKPAVSAGKKPRKRKILVSSTDSETDLSDGTCMCKKCKIKRKYKKRKN